MKVAPFVLALAGFTSAEKCSASRGPRPDFEADVTVAPVTEGWRQVTTEAPFYESKFITVVFHR